MFPDDAAMRENTHSKTSHRFNVSYCGILDDVVSVCCLPLNEEYGVVKRENPPVIRLIVSERLAELIKTRRI